MKTALITGASGAIGAALARKFAENGYFTIGTFNTGEKRIEALQESLKEYKDFFFAVHADFKDVSAAEKVMDYAEKNFGHVDVLVNNAGTGLYKLASETTEAELREVMSVNFSSAYMLSARALKKMSERKKGKIIFVSSVWGIAGACMESAYSASKAALTGLTKSLAKEAGPSGITVNCVCPGVVDTPMNARFSDEEMRELIDRTPLGRLGNAEEISELIFFLASDKADFITGQIITADGGFAL